MCVGDFPDQVIIGDIHRFQMQRLVSVDRASSIIKLPALVPENHRAGRELQGRGHDPHHFADHAVGIKNRRENTGVLVDHLKLRL